MYSAWAGGRESRVEGVFPLSPARSSEDGHGARPTGTNSATSAELALGAFGGARRRERGAKDGSERLQVHAVDGFQDLQHVAAVVHTSVRPASQPGFLAGSGFSFSGQAFRIPESEC